MRAAESLFEFMPYGAPELLQSRRERLASALLFSSLATAAAFVAAGGLARLIAVPPRVVVAASLPPHDVTPQPSWRLPPPPAPALQPRVPPIAGVPRPAAEPDVPLVTDEVKPASSVVAGTPASGPPSDAAIAPPPEDALPPPGTRVWAEQYPEPITQVTPHYPEVARDAGVDGLVIVNVLVGKTGRVLGARLDEKRQVPMLNEAALAAARQWVFTPALANGKPVAVWTGIPFKFVLR